MAVAASGDILKLPIVEITEIEGGLKHTERGGGHAPVASDMDWKEINIGQHTSIEGQLARMGDRVAIINLPAFINTQELPRISFKLSLK